MRRLSSPSQRVSGSWVAAALTVAALLSGCAGTPRPRGAEPAAAAAAAAAPAVPRAAHPAPTITPAHASPGSGVLLEDLGVRVQGLKLTADGYVVDLRYRVLDPDKARPLLDRKVRPVLVDESTGKRYYVPSPPIVGSLRQTARNKVIHTDRNYFILFANPDRQLQAGSLVTLHVGDRKADQLRIDEN
jgi:hypothetical protein